MVPGLPLIFEDDYGPPLLFKVRKPPLKEAKRLAWTVADQKKRFSGLFPLLLPGSR